MGSLGAPPCYFLFSKYWQIWSQTPSKQEITQVLGWGSGYFERASYFCAPRGCLSSKCLLRAGCIVVMNPVYALQGVCREKKPKLPYVHLAKLAEERLLRVCIVFFFFFLKTKNGNKSLKPTSPGLTRMSMKSPEQGKRPRARRREWEERIDDKVEGQSRQQRDWEFGWQATPEAGAS